MTNTRGIKDDCARMFIPLQTAYIESFTYTSVNFSLAFNKYS